jgi:hypothetical protein
MTDALTGDQVAKLEDAVKAWEMNPNGSVNPFEAKEKRQ